MQYLCIMLGVALLLVSGLWLYQRRQNECLLERFDTMLKAAQNGDFDAIGSRFDESWLSAVETRFRQYLKQQQLTAGNNKAERDKITQLVADIAHQTKTPVANLMLYAQLLCEQPLAADSMSYAQLLVQQSEKLHFLLQALLKTARLETGIITLHPAKNSVAELLQAIQQQVQAQLQEKQQSLSIEPMQIDALFDPKWTAEALYNIVDNAIKYTPAGGKLTITVAIFQFFCQINITDQGYGIAEEEYSKIFKRFYRSPRTAQEQGVGIGLFLAREIISGQEGYIRVLSEPDKGSTFSVFLPLA